jgi:uncharacterized membrane protein
VGPVSQRNRSADLNKGIAVILMIQVHLMEQFATVDLYNSILGKISLFLGGPACAPVFMAVMGYYLATSKKSLGGFLKRGSLLFFGGLLLNATRSANLLYRIYMGEMDVNPWQYIFGADILTLAGLSVIALGLLRLVLKNKCLPYFALSLIMAAISPFLIQYGYSEGFKGYFNAFFIGVSSWSYFPIFPWMSYVLAGYAFKLLINKALWIQTLQIKERLSIFIPGLIVLLLTLPWAVPVIIDLEGSDGYYHHGILLFLWNLLFISFYLVLITHLDTEFGNSKISASIRWIGANVTVLYVIQWLLIGNIATALYRTQDIFQVAAWFPVILLITYLIGYLYIRIKSVLR